MDVTEAPPEALAVVVEQGSDDYFAADWAAPVAVGPDPRDFERAISLTIAQANVIRGRDETINALRRGLAQARDAERAAVKRCDEALGAAHRYESASIRLGVDNRALRERVEALTRANQARPSLAARFGSWAR